MGRTVLSEALTLGLELPLVLLFGLGLLVWVGHSCPTLLTLGLMLLSSATIGSTA